MANPPRRRKYIDMQERETRFRNETTEPLVKCMFCQQMLPKVYEAIQAHVDAVHKEKKRDANPASTTAGDDDVDGSTEKTNKSSVKNGMTMNGAVAKKRKRKRPHDASASYSNADDAENAEALRMAKNQQPPDRHRRRQSRLRHLRKRIQIRQTRRKSFA